MVPAHRDWLVLTTTLLLGAGPLPAQSSPSSPPASYGPDFLVPTGKARMVYRHGQDAPQRVTDFWSRNSRAWLVYWDATLDVPRLVIPLEPTPVLQPGTLALPRDEGAVVRDVEAWLDARSDFLGVDPSRLGQPYVYEIANALVLVFPQTTPGGVTVRGASLRVVLHKAEGRLGWIKAFVARGIEDPPADRLASGDIEALLAATGVTAHEAELQVGFETNELASARALWQVAVTDAGGRGSRLLLDARSGETLGQHVHVKHFDPEGEGAGFDFQDYVVGGEVTALCPDLDDPFRDPWYGDRHTPQPVEGVLIRDRAVIHGNDEPRLPPLTFTDETGSYVGILPDVRDTTTLHASLEWGNIVERSRAHLDGFAPVLSVEPVGGVGFLEPATDETDADENGVPNLTRAGARNRPFEFRFNAGTARGSEADLMRAYWVQCFHFARKMLVSAETALRVVLKQPKDTVRYGSWLPMSPLCIVPLPPAAVLVERSRCMQLYVGPNNTCGWVPPADRWDPFNPMQRQPATVMTTLFFSGTDFEFECVEDALERIVPTILQHEVGHHVFFHMTNAFNVGLDPTGLEDGVADALVVLDNQNALIGYRRLDNLSLVPTARGFSVDTWNPNRPDFRHPLRAEVGLGFWEYLRIMRARGDDDESPEEAEARAAHPLQLLLAWLAQHRVEQGEQVIFRREPSFLQELLLADDSFGENSDLNLANGTPHAGAIDAAFGPRRSFFEAPFLRGDANLDARVDISDTVAILRHLFQGDGRFVDCENAKDADDSGAVDLTDGILILLHLFQGTARIPPPFPDCGFDREFVDEAGNLGCVEYRCPL